MSATQTGVLTAMCGTKLDHGVLADSVGHDSGVQAESSPGCPCRWFWQGSGTQEGPHSK